MSLTVQKKKIKRVSHLPQPILKLSGHTGPIYGLEFSFDGQKMVSCGKELLLWRTDKEVDNYGIIDIKRPVLQSRWSRDQTQIYCASAAQVLNIYDVDSGELVTSFKHNGIVNSCSANKRGQEMVCTGSDDGFIRVWDLRTSQAIKKYETRLPVTAVEFQIDGSFVYTGGIDETIKGWDLRTDTVSLQLEGHIDTILGLRLSPNGQHLLSNALDNTVRIWDVKPFCVGPRDKTLQGAPQGYEKNLVKPCWSPDGDFVCCGGADRTVTVWSVQKQRIVYKLPGHQGVVTGVDWHGNVIASAGTDGSIFLGELDTSEVK